MNCNKFKYGMMAAAVVLAASCTDFDDYNEAYQTGSPESQKTLWENISEREELSQFASLLEKVGYDKVLSSSRFYTVFAPENNTFDFDTYNAMDSANLVDRFVNCNVADYNYVVSAPKEQRVEVLSEKRYDLQNVTGLTFGDNNILSANIPSINGTIHITDGASYFVPNLYEYIFDQAEEDTSMYQYFSKYEQTYLDVANSVVGPIDSLGRQTYSDSVIIVRNVICDETIYAALDNEDSIYTMIYPTDHAYDAAYKRISSYFNLPSTMKYYITTADGTGEPLTLSDENGDYDKAELSDSLIRRSIVSSLALSHGNKYNYWLEETGHVSMHDPKLLDSLSTTGRGPLLSNGQEVIAQTLGEPVKVSNGYVRRVDSLALRSWDVWCPEIHVDLSRDRGYGISVSSATMNTLTLIGEGETTTYRYLDVRSSGENNSTLYFNIPNVRSAEYNIYIVFVPEFNAPLEDRRPLKFNVSVCCNTSDGGSVTLSPTASSGFAFNNLATSRENLNKIDTFFVGKVKFPYCYAGLDEDCRPNLKFAVNRNFMEQMMGTYTNNFRIADIILRPVEYDEMLKKEDEAL